MKNLFLPLAVFFSILSTQAGAAEAKTILVLGDSLSQGFGLKPREAYPMLLAEKLRAAGLNFRVINASAAGTPPKAVCGGSRDIFSVPSTFSSWSWESMTLFAACPSLKFKAICSKLSTG